MNIKLNKILNLIDEWCADHGLSYHLVCDEDDLQGYVISKKGRIIEELLRLLEPLVVEGSLYMRCTATRTGTILALSIQPISEDVLASFNANQQTPLARRLSYIFRSFSEGCPVTGGRKMPKPRRKVNTERRLREDLEGVAAEHQPEEVLDRLEAALRDTKLIPALKKAGVSNKLSDDRQRIIFFIIDETGNEHEVITFELTALGDQNEMRKALDYLHDLTRQQAPGTRELQRKKIKDEETKLNTIAKTYAMPPEVPTEGYQVVKEGDHGNGTLGMPAAEIRARAAAFRRSIEAGRYTMEKMESNVRGWVPTGMITKKQAEELINLVKKSGMKSEGFDNKISKALRLDENMEEFKDYEFYNAWQMIQSHISSAKSYLEDGQDIEAVLKRVAKLVKSELMNLELYMQSEGRVVSTAPLP